MVIPQLIGLGVATKNRPPMSRLSSKRYSDPSEMHLCHAKEAILQSIPN